MPAHQGFATIPKLSMQSIPSTKGQTRTNNGRLEYLNPMSETWVPAVRLQRIRQRILNQSFQGTPGYAFQKSHGNTHGLDPANYTSFLLQDQSYGKDRAHRNPILFQIKPTDTGEKPTGYVTYSGRIVLDMFDHAIRDFGDAMPLCISSFVDGWDIETYLRRNREIKKYDITARMPDSYLKGKKATHRQNGPPGRNALSMRATRFRLQAGCLSWTEKSDTKTKNEMMLSIIPQAYQDANSTQGFRDITVQEQKACETGKGKHPKKGRKKAQRGIKIEDDSEDDGITHETRDGGFDADDIGLDVKEESKNQERNLNALQTVEKRVLRPTNKRGRVPSEDSGAEEQEGEEIQQPSTKRQRIQEDDSDDSGSEFEPDLPAQPPKENVPHIKRSETQSPHAGNSNDEGVEADTEGAPTGNEAEDFRYSKANRIWTAKVLSKAMALTRIDYYLKTEEMPPLQNCRDQTYADLWRTIDNKFQALGGAQLGHPLYLLPPWYQGFEYLEDALDERGFELLEMLEEDESLGWAWV